MQKAAASLHTRSRSAREENVRRHRKTNKFTINHFTRIEHPHGSTQRLLRRDQTRE